MENKNQFTEVLLLDKDSVIIKNDLIAENGNFTLKINNGGGYTLKVKQLNHFLYKKDIQVNSDLNLGTISIENAKEIKDAHKCMMFIEWLFEWRNKITRKDKQAAFWIKL